MNCCRTRRRRKKRRIRRAIAQLPRRSVLLAQDETDLLLFPPLRAGWALRGQPMRVRLTGRNARRVVFGALNLCSGRRVLLAQPHQRADDFQAFLERVHWHYRGQHVALLLDEDPSHTADSSQALAGHFGMHLLWLPKRCPELNPLEGLWGQGKEVVCANKQYATIDEQVERFIAYLSVLSNHQALRTAGVLSRQFWLRHVLSKNFCGPA